MTSRSRCPVQIQEAMDTFLAPTLGASESKQLWERCGSVRSKGPQDSGAVPLSAWGQTTLLPVMTREISGQKCEGQSRKEKEGWKGSPYPHRPKLPLSSPSSSLPTLHRPSSEKLLMDFYHGQITHLQKMLLQMGKSPRNHARDSLGQILLLGIISPYYRSTEGCPLARCLLLMNSAAQNWPRGHKSHFASQWELITSRKPCLSLQETHTNASNIWGLV